MSSITHWKVKCGYGYPLQSVPYECGIMARFIR